MKAFDQNPNGLSQRGVTLIELMIGMVVSTILIAFILGSVANMTAAYRNHDKVNAQTLSLRSGRDYLVREGHMAGRFITRFSVATGALGTTVDTLLRPVTVVNGGGAVPDTLRIYYADGAAQVPVSAFDNDTATISNAALSIPVNSVVARIGPRLVPGPTAGSKLVEYDACILKVTAITSTSATFATSGTPYNAANNPHCDDVKLLSGLFLSPFVGRSFRINTTNSTLEMSPNGELETNPAWTTVGTDYVNLQVASRYFETGNGADPDGDLDPLRDWYSSSSQHEPDPFNARPTSNTRMTMLSLGLTTRTLVSGVPSPTTPPFILTSNVNNNQFGDSPEVAVTTSHVYRSTRVLVELRNLSAGL